MTDRPDRHRAATLGAAIGRATTLAPHIISDIVMKLQTISTAQKTSAVNVCNIPNFQGIHDDRTMHRRKRAAAILELVRGAYLTLGGDPRGCVCYLYIPKLHGDSHEEDAKTKTKLWGVY
mgnify:CR=1 FL=1